MIEDKEVFLKHKNDNIIKYLCDHKKTATPTYISIIRLEIKKIKTFLKEHEQ